MSFATDLTAIMDADASLNDFFDGNEDDIVGGVMSDTLIDNFNLEKKWLLYYFNQDEQVDCITSKDVYGVYNVTIVMIMQDTADMYYWTDYLKAYLNNKSYGGIQDMGFLSDDPDVDNEKDIALNALQFRSIYAT